ncbi:ATPase, T2SS/T4P/T4SS family [Tibeticola sp.]|uniref:GspE/PulE family protein n=1 Tax=Tibeticola sp. TaxID=2005368 RepID=UPI0025876E93|nr:ATPase, T2SS/T4P/T4SS family [Tibeticola sp.]
MTTAAPAPTIEWPLPPFASYAQAEGVEGEWECEVEGLNGQTRRCLLVGFDPLAETAWIRVPPSRARLPVQFSMFRRLRILTPLSPDHLSASSGPQAQLVEYRARLPYRVRLRDETVFEGETIGHTDTPQGLFLFEPIDEHDRVRRVFIPRGVIAQAQIGAALGEVLVAQKVVSPAQVEQALQEQDRLRQRKLGDYLVSEKIVTPEQLLEALEAQARMPLVRLGEALTGLGMITPEQLEEALERQKTERSVPLGEILVRSGQLSRHDLQVALARKMGYPIVDLKQFPIDAEAVRRVPFALARRLRIVPLLWRSGTLIIASDDPTRQGVLDEIEFATQAKVVAALAAAPIQERDIAEVYRRLGGAPEVAPGVVEWPDDAAAFKAGELLEQLEQFEAPADEEHEPLIEQSDNQLVRLIHTLIIEAHQQGASDIHIETFPNRRKVRIRLRKDGRLEPYMELPHTYRAAIVARIKIMCDLDISERRKPQDGKINFARFVPGQNIELRVATIPTFGGAEDVVLRILASAKPVPLQELGLAPANLATLREAVERPYGMILCVGPTGSGKTTTLHSLLQHINTPERKIWTAEDPVEITNPDLRQVQVNPKIDWTFAKALRAFLRADPDVIMVGEIRDIETAHMSVEASLTGHLVLSTLHTNSAPETVTRLLDMGMDPFNFSDSLLAVLAQRLVRRLCPDCRVAEPLSAEMLTELVDDYLLGFPDDLRPTAQAVRQDWQTQLGSESPLRHHRSPGCPACNHTGYRGRVGLHELLRVNLEIRRLIQQRGAPQQIQHAAMRAGAFRTLRQDGILKVLQGLTSLDEVRANTSHL